MNVVYRFRIYPNKSQQELFAKTFGCVRFVYNRMLAEKMDHYEKTGRTLKVTPAKYKEEFPWLKEVDSLLLKGATVCMEADGKYYVSLLYCCEEQPAAPGEPRTAIGLDFSMTELYMSSDGEHGEYPHYFRISQIKLAREQRKLSRCQKGSSRYRKQQKKVARIHAHVAHQRKDFLHKESRKITNSCDIVCIEDLDMKAMSRGLNFGKSVADNGWGMFTNFLSYKLEQEGKQLVRIGRWYPSSKTCSCCGRVKKDLGLEERIYRCECGNRMDRDENAAVNIRREGLRILGITLDMEKIAS